jgi:hypothetical protein
VLLIASLPRTTSMGFSATIDAKVYGYLIKPLQLAGEAAGTKSAERRFYRAAFL